MTTSWRSGGSGASSPGGTIKPVENYRTEGAKVLLLIMGSLGEVAEVAVDEMREAGPGRGPD